MNEKKEVIFRAENLQTWFPITKGPFKKVVGHVKAVDGVDIEVYKGETLGIVGESGCGKSTLGKTLMMLEHATGGHVFFNYDNEFRDITAFNKKEMFDFRRKVQMVFQDPYSALNPQKKIYTSFEEPLKVHGMSLQEEREARMRQVYQWSTSNRIILCVIHMNFPVDRDRDFALPELWKCYRRC